MRGKKVDPELISRCLQLRQSGYSLDEIVVELDLPKTTVYSYIKNSSLPSERIDRNRDRGRQFLIKHNAARKGKSKPENRIYSRPKWSPVLIRILAHFLFDGSIDYHHLAYYNRSTKLIEMQKLAINELFGLEGRLSSGRGDVLRLTYGSVEFVALVKDLINQMQLSILKCPVDYRRAYLKAFFDDEGNVFMSREGQGRRVRGYQYDIAMLKLIVTLLRDFDIHASIDRACYAVVIRGKANLERFASEINFTPGIFLNPHRANSIYMRAIDKHELLNIIISSYR